MAEDQIVEKAEQTQPVEAQQAEVAEKVEKTNETKVSDVSASKDKSSKKVNNKKKDKKDKKPKQFTKRVKETTSELKKVTWPSFKEVCKKTGVVLAVVIVFAGVLLLIDYLLGLLFGLLK